MQSLEIITLPNEVLRAPTKKVGTFDSNLASLIENMRTTMYQAEGVGLAAPQIGLSQKLAIIEFDPKRFRETDDEPAIPFMVIANPTITKYNDEFEVYEEGCLSVPELSTPVPRATEITVLAQTLTGERIRIRAKDFLARILQHEIDHLNGLLIVDRTMDKKVKKKYAAS